MKTDSLGEGDSVFFERTNKQTGKTYMDSGEVKKPNFEVIIDGEMAVVVAFDSDNKKFYLPPSKLSKISVL